MRLAFIIFKKFIKSNRRSGFLNLISTISIAGITLGVATLIIALSVITGFEKTLTEKLTEIDSHIKIQSFTKSLPETENALMIIDSICGNYLDYSSPYYSDLSLIGFGNRKDGVTIKGIINKGFKEKVAQNIIDGELNFQIPNNLVIGKTLANKLLVKVGETVTLFALKDNKIPDKNDFPNIEKFKVTGIFESGIAEYDASLAFTDIKSAQNLFSVSGKINGIDVKLNDISKADSLSLILRKELRYPYFARSIFDIHKNIFTWIALQKKPIPIILGLIIIVAVFNIVGTLLLMVIERTNSIGILKSFGTRKRHIILIFILQGFYLALIGTIAGNLLAISLIKLQSEFNIIKVPSSVYFVTKVPFDYSLWIFVVVSIVTIFLALIASVIPSIISAKISPIKALRFD